MLKYEGTDKIRDIKYEGGYVDKIYYDNNTQLVFTSDKEKTSVDEVLFKGRKLIDVTSYGKCLQNGTPTPDAPVDIVCNNGVLKWDSANQSVYTDGTVETINVHGKNLFDPNEQPVAFEVYFGVPLNQYTTGNYWLSMTRKQGADVPSGALGVVFRKNDSAGPSARWFVNNGEEHSYLMPNGSSLNFISTDDVRYIGLAVYPGNVETWAAFMNAYNIQIEQGTRATEYEPYFNGGTATAEMLLKVGDYQDQQEILSGAITRNVGVKVFNGTEKWAVTAGTDNAYLQASELPGVKKNSPVLCSHLINSSTGTLRIQLYDVLRVYGIGTEWADKTNFKSWLADQYAAGTPVIVVYPLATPTTEQVLGQQLTIQQGNNTVEVTQASVDDILLKVKYK